MVKTKIIATIGPASDNYTVLRKMVIAGLDVIRLNFSHGTHAGHLRSIELIRQINSKYKRHIRILQDLEGFRIRIGRLKGGKPLLLKKRTTIWLIAGASRCSFGEIPLDYEDDLRRIGAGQLIYIDDGNIILKVKKAYKSKLQTEVVEGGLLKSRKGVNVPGVRFPFSGLTEKDKNDLEFGIAQKVDFVAQSFVSTKKDVETVKKVLKKHNASCKVIAKIETREAIKNIDGIIDASDGIMIARGDMGISVPIYEVPIIQKRIIRKCNKNNKFVITATQMLEHMTEHSRPTRAEVADVANAILDGTDYVMLSGESAAGAFPVESVVMMNAISKFTEESVKM